MKVQKKCFLNILSQLRDSNPRCVIPTYKVGAFDHLAKLASCGECKIRTHGSAHHRPPIFKIGGINHSPNSPFNSNMSKNLPTKKLPDF